MESTQDKDARIARTLLDAEGENRALCTFLLLYGSGSSVSIAEMRKHMKRYGWDGCWPAWVAFPADGHITKSGAQLWIRHLISLEQVPLVRAPLPMTQERFNEKMNALDAANPAPLAHAQAGVLTDEKYLFSLDRIAEACAFVGIRDSQFESLSIELLNGGA